MIIQLSFRLSQVDWTSRLATRVVVSALPASAPTLSVIRKDYLLRSLLERHVS